MNTKRVVIGILITAVTGGLLLSGCGRHRGHLCSDKLPEKILKRMDRKVAKLDLNGAQQAQYNVIRKEVKADLTAMQQRHRDAGKVIGTELEKQNPDMESIVKTVKETHGKRPEVFNKYADLLLGFYNSLDSEQQAKVLDKFRDHADRFKCE